MKGFEFAKQFNTIEEKMIVLYGYGGIDKRCPKCSQVLVW